MKQRATTVFQTRFGLEFQCSPSLYHLSCRDIPPHTTPGAKLNFMSFYVKDREGILKKVSFSHVDVVAKMYHLRLFFDREE